MPVERARSAAPAESQEGAPARSELEAVLRHRFNGLSEEERIRECFYDSNTGLPNERGFEILRGGAARADSLYAHYSIEGPKWINDVFTHDQGQMLYRMAACALHSAAPNVAKVRGDFIGAVASMEDARERAAAANRALPEAFRGFTITVHVGPAWDDLGVQHGAWKDQEERAGRRAGRGERPFGVEPRWTPKEGPF